MKKLVYTTLLLLSLSLSFVSCERDNKQTNKNENTNKETSQKETVEAEKTIAFIDNELIGIEESLYEAETELKYFDQQDLMDFSPQANQIYTSLCALEKERAEITVNLKIYKRMQDYIKVKIDDPENLASPSTMGVNDPMLNQLASDLVTLSQTKATKLLSQTEQQPEIMKLNEQIVIRKRALQETINNLVDNAQLNLNDIERRISSLEAETHQLPVKEQDLFNCQRNFDFLDATYKCLINHREEVEALLDNV